VLDADSAAVLCSVSGCDHLDCHGGPFQPSSKACVYTSETGAWSTPVSLRDDCNAIVIQTFQTGSGLEVYRLESTLEVATTPSFGVATTLSFSFYLSPLDLKMNK
jgi:hypothetical protein